MKRVRTTTICGLAMERLVFSSLPFQSSGTLSTNSQIDSIASDSIEGISVGKMVIRVRSRCVGGRRMYTGEEELGLTGAC
jgi:hypothetical protein